MRYMKMLGLAAVAIAALMACVGAGTATAGGVLCSATESSCKEVNKWATPTTLDFSLKSGTSARLSNAAKPTETLDTCTGSSSEAGKSTTVKGSLTENPSGSGEATGNITELLWRTCTFPTTTIATGKLRVLNIVGTSNGTVIADSEILVTIKTVLFGPCVYGVKAGAHLGVVFEGLGTGSVFRAENAAVEKLTGESAPCPSNALWTAEYVLTTPSATTLSISSN